MDEVERARNDREKYLRIRKAETCPQNSKIPNALEELELLVYE